jgi:hypothetical protein
MFLAGQAAILRRTIGKAQENVRKSGNTLPIFGP